MSQNPASGIPQASASQVSKEVVFNEALVGVEWAWVYAYDAPNSSGLTWAYGGGRWGGISVSAGSVSLVGGSPTTVNYLVVKRDTGVLSVSQSSTNWDNHADYARVYKVTASGSAVESHEDHRAGPHGVHGSPARGYPRRQSIAVGGSPPTYTLNEVQAGAAILEFTGTLTENETVIVPTVVDEWIVYNNCSGSPPFTLTLKTSAGSGIAIDQGKRAILYCDGTNVVRASADV